MAKSASKIEEAAAFHGFSPAFFTFIDGLAAHQTREWFLDNKTTYEREVRAPLAAFIESLALAFAARDLPLTGSAKTSLFRINRDVRFSKDKSPYKTNASAVLSRDGTKAAKGVFYFHVGGIEREAMMAMGFYGPEPSDLRALRDAIAGGPERWLAVVEALGQAGLKLSMDGSLARMPKGFESLASSAIAPSLKLRSLVVVHPIDIASVGDVGLIDEAVTFATSALPLLEFGWKALRA